MRHGRLIAFFVLVSLAGAGAGILAARAGGPELEPQRVAAVAAAVTGELGFAGVLFHRLRILRQKFRETENYLHAIERESRKYRALLEGAADMVLVLDPQDGAVLECNARARELLGVPAAGATLARLLGTEEAGTLWAAFARAGNATAASSELRVRAAGGRQLVCEARFAAVELDDRRVVHLALRDRTREREIENELALHERMSSLGLLTAGVAHEINNPLEGIANHLRLLGRTGLDPGERERHVDLVQHGFERIRDLVRDLLRFARPASQRGDVDLAQVVDRAHRLATYADRFREVEVVLRGLEAPLHVLGDAGRLEQVVFNLLLNAATAMNGRGRITVEARPAGEGSGQVELAIIDAGPGIPAQDLERIFDPFFSTGGGTGLGLSIVFGIVRAHGGSIAARNLAAGGAEFVVRLPRTGPASTEEAT